MHQILLGVGSNHNAESNIRAGLEQLTQFCSNIEHSPCYRSSAIDLSQPDYLNLVTKAETSLDHHALIEALKSIEIQQGRMSGRYCALDIDLLCFDQEIIESEQLNLPHKDLEHYAHVLLPAADLCPNQQHPTLGYTFIELWNKKRDLLLENQSLYPHSL